MSQKDSKVIYLPLSDEEEGLLKKGSNNRRGIHRRPYLLISMIAACLIFVFGIGMLMNTEKNNPISAVRDAKNKRSGPLPLILVSIDGFRYDYLKRGLTPNLQKMIKKGVYGPMKPQFPSYTFPNHFTLVTGLYPESHGIVGNAFYDPGIDDYFSYTNQENLKESKWWKAEPIWNAVQRFGMKSATMFWPGSESKINGRRPSYFVDYNGEVPTEARVDQVLKWLDLPSKKRPNFISLYISLVDDVGHIYGPESEELDSALMLVDAGIGRLLLGLEERGLDDLVNLIVVSDHGMVEIPDDERFHIYLDDLIPQMESRLKWVDYGPMASIIPKNKHELESVYADLKKCQLQGVPIQVFKRAELPEHFHYKQNDRIAPIIVMARKGFIIDFRGGEWVPRGAHGYDPSLSEMQAIFIANGPNFKAATMKTNQALKGVTNLDVYPLMMNLLKIAPAPNNGTMTLVDLIR